MANGGGPACLRLRVVADPDRIDPRFLVDNAALDRIEAVISHYWVETIFFEDISSPTLWKDAETARHQLLNAILLNALL